MFEDESKPTQEVEPGDSYSPDTALPISVGFPLNPETNQMAVKYEYRDVASQEDFTMDIMAKDPVEQTCEEMFERGIMKEKCTTRLCIFQFSVLVNKIVCVDAFLKKFCLMYYFISSLHAHSIFLPN